MVVDTAAVKARVDLLALIGADVHLRKIASTRGGEWAGPCPSCGGEDRLRVQPEQGLWWCRQCGGDRWQDAIAYVQRRDGCDFAEAVRLLGGGNVPIRSTPPVAPVPADLEPTPEWRAAAALLVERCVADLRSDLGARARAWLETRGIRDGTARAWDLGYNHRDREMCGLWVERGIIIPWWVDGQLWHVNVRRPIGEPKYKAIAGGHPYMFGADRLDGRDVAVLTEGEFDAMLLNQEAGDLAGIATLGSASKGLSPRAMRWLLPVSRICLAYDTDASGANGAARLAGLSARVRQLEAPIRPPAGKDLTDYWKAGGDLRGWLAYNLDLLAAGGGGGRA